MLPLYAKMTRKLISKTSMIKEIKIRMDGLIGVEPIFTNPEFVVLPLDDSPFQKRYFIEFCFKKSIRAGGILKFRKILDQI